MTALNVGAFVRSLLRDYRVSKAFPATYHRGRGRLVAVTGDNASGKSLFAKLANAVLRKRKIEPMLVGMSLRAQGGIMRAFVFGDEDTSSTGCNSVQSVLGGLRTARGRKYDHALLLDEPDVGLSEGWQSAVGELIAGFAADLPERTKMLMVVTHSRRLLEKLAPLEPHHVRFGDGLNLVQVVEAVPVAHPASGIEKLLDENHNGLCRVSKLTEGKD